MRSLKKVRLRNFRAGQIVNRVLHPVYRTFGKMSKGIQSRHQQRLAKRLWRFAKDNKGLRAFGRSPFSRRMVRRLWNLMSAGRFSQALGLICLITSDFRGWKFVHHRDGTPFTTTVKVSQVILRNQSPSDGVFRPSGRVRKYFRARW